MRELLAEILRYVELEHVQGVAEVPPQLKELVVPAAAGGAWTTTRWTRATSRGA